MRNITARLVGLNTAGWLSLAAAPTFAVMAVLTSIPDGGAQPMSCSMHMSPLSGMASMYWLMSAFHLAPWFRVVFLRNGDPVKQS